MKNRLEVHIIVAMDEAGAIGANGDMPWGRGLPADLKHFKQTTMGYPIIMGRRTFESFPKGALPGRTNIVVTHNPEYQAEGIVVANDLEKALEQASQESEKAFIIGGGQLYQQSLEQDLVDVLHLTLVHHTWSDADTHLPALDLDKWLFVEEEKHEADEKNLYRYSFTRFVRKKSYPTKTDVNG